MYHARTRALSTHAAFTLPIIVTQSTRRFARHDEPVRVGIPLPRGVCAELPATALVDASGTPCPLQWRALERWPDGSLRWVLADFTAAVADAASSTIYRVLLADTGQPRATARETLQLVDAGHAVVIDTGAARFRLSAAGPFPVDEASNTAGALIDAGRCALRIEDAAGSTHTPTWNNLSVEESGPLRAVVRLEGSAGPAGASLELTARLHFFAASPAVQIALTIRNPRPAAHPGNFWELGDPGSILLRDVSVHLALAGDQPVSTSCSPEPGAPLIPMRSGLELFQASSGAPNWSSSNHVNAQGIVPLAFRGYRLRTGGSETHGERATPIVCASRGAQRLTVSVPEFWQNFPKAIAVDQDTVRVQLFPPQHGDAHELQGGEQKTHTFWIAVGEDGISDVPLDWTRDPLLAHLRPEDYCAAGAMPYLTPETDASDPELRELVRAAIEGDESFAAKQQRLDEFGWRNYGDLYADHETMLPGGPQPIVSHYNNQYDGVAAFASQFMRTGDVRWWPLFTTLARHVVDIDIYHTEGDKSAFNGGLFWHTAHYTDAGRSSHRSYPRAPGVPGGGPSCEHNYPTGLMLHYLLTGDVQSRDAAIGLARWVVNMDDGSRTVFRYLARGETGVASATVTPLYHGPGRGAGNSIVALLTAHRLTNEPQYLAKAEALIRRCVHPHDDIDARTLLNAELRWSYTVFLSALGRYLDHKAERGELDSMYAYARASLLAYADWMRTHERPYLEHPEQLEFPNETWAAQELWKVRALLIASKYAAPAERPAYLQRAGEFFRYAISTLRRMETRALARPLILLAGQGYVFDYFRVHPDTIAPTPQVEHGGFGEPTVFVPQKARARTRAMVLAACGGVAVVAAALALLLR